MVDSLDKETEKRLFDYFSKTYPSVDDFTYVIKGDMIELSSSTSISESKPSLEHFGDVEEILNASFITVISENGKYASLYKFND